MSHPPALPLIVAALCATTSFAVADERETFFETRIRPLLARHCIECHGADKQEGTVRLDTRDHAVARTEAGPIVLPGKPDASRLMQVVRYDELDVQMPPKAKLPAEALADLERWITDGAFWPEAATVERIPVTHVDEIARLRTEHWSFRPVERPAIPIVAGATTAIDAFIRRQLAEHDLAPSPAADRRTLIRRLTFDLHGLPPTFEEVERFANDPAPNAYEQLVDRLLASPRFGERWGRYWLDIARYADTKGYVFTEQRFYPYAYTYRDYVVRALNEDKPFDRFAMEQIAADRLDLADDPRAIAALGFLTVGQRFMNREPDIIDDRIDVVTRGFLGLTVACARCHDHKYDPLPTADYYSLYGIFDSTHEPTEQPLVAMPEETEAYAAFKTELDKRQAAHDDFVAAAVAKLQTDLRTHAGDYLVAIVKQTKQVPDEFYVAIEPGQTRPQLVTKWTQFLARHNKPDDPVFGPFVSLLKLPADDGFADAVTAWLEANCDRCNALVVGALREARPKSPYEVATTYGTLFAEIESRWREHLGSNSGDKPAEKLPDAAAEELRSLLYDPDGPIPDSVEEAQPQFDRETRNKASELLKAVESWKVNSLDAPPRAMTLLDDDRPTEPVVFIRGTVGRRGERVPRRAPQIVAGLDSPAFTQGSGRLELAATIADPSNPLTARVHVNRVWLHLFDSGLVTTPSDFGLRSEPPSHPELLDWLAAEFVANGWSTKRLIRSIVLSETYLQASTGRPEIAAVDPENRLLARQNRKRLDFEAGRDAVLAVAGRLDSTMNGRPVDVTDPAVHRRTLYGLVDRNNLPTLFRTFDFASPDTSTAERPETTVPQQALFGLNSPFVLENAKALAARVAGEPDGASRVRNLYRHVLARDPSDAESAAAERFLAAQPPTKLTPLEKLAHVLLLTNEFAFVD